MISSCPGQLSDLARQLARNRSVAEREVKSCALASLPVGPDRASVAFNDPLDGGKTDSGSFEFAGRMQALKGREHFRRLGGVEARSIVFDEIGATPALDRRANGDDRMLFLPRILEGVRHEVLQ